MAITRNKQRTTGATTIGMPGSRALGGSRHPFQPSAHHFSSNYRNRLSTLSISVLTQAGCRLSLGGVSASRLVLKHLKAPKSGVTRRLGHSVLDFPCDSGTKSVGGSKQFGMLKLRARSLGAVHEQGAASLLGMQMRELSTVPNVAPDILATPMPSIDSISPDESWAASPFIPSERVGQG